VDAVETALADRFLRLRSRAGATTEMDHLVYLVVAIVSFLGLATASPSHLQTQRLP